MVNPTLEQDPKTPDVKDSQEIINKEGAKAAEEIEVENLETEADERVAVEQAREAVVEAAEQPVAQAPVEEEPTQAEQAPAGSNTEKKWYNPMTWF
ncbi:MAG: hypothetical protein WC323_01380 [Patescibacteria group bacterium]|jgi:lipoate-protein ligase A